MEARSHSQLMQKETEWEEGPAAGGRKYKRTEGPLPRSSCLRRTGWGI